MGSSDNNPQIEGSDYLPLFSSPFLCVIAALRAPLFNATPDKNHKSQDYRPQAEISCQQVGFRGCPAPVELGGESSLSWERFLLHFDGITDMRL